MSEARQIGEIVRPIVGRAVQMLEFQRMLTRCPSPTVRESFIRSAWSHDVLTEDEAFSLLRMPENHSGGAR